MVDSVVSMSAFLISLPVLFTLLAITGAIYEHVQTKKARESLQRQSSNNTEIIQYNNITKPSYRKGA